MSKIQLRDVNKHFGTTHVLKDITLTVEPGEFCVFIGPSGCGKSTLLRLIAGLDDASSGEIEIDGRRVDDLPPAKRNVAMVFQSYALYPHMTAFENMAFGLRHLKLPAGEIDRRVAEASRILRLDELLQRKPRDMSGGQRQRVAIGRAIVRQPKVFLFDEPLSNLDASLRVKTRVEIARLHRDLGSASMVYVTHDQVEAMTLAHKIVLLRPDAERQGLPSIAQVGHPLELYHRPANRFVAGFIGSPAMNFLPGTITQVTDRGLQALVLGASVSARVQAAAVRQALPVGGDVTIGIRPEHVVLGQGDRNAVVTHLEHLGEHSYAYLHAGDGTEAFMAKTLDASLRVGSAVPFSFPPEHVHVFLPDGQAVTRLDGPALRVAA
ncbi:ABC transporter ATP-binding protein [Rhizobacter sp. Root1221]|uniref:ABC transporter ATP-binding protein n=1 Tax=Rhizobacter sp. Root1221 TaxID=1736433 RepID=UPI0006F579E5|nr:ATP-binding cassette domain-containing protein [Rhizobacter sp. Root1221]KQW00631.1 ABC transporter [Rhizobacter sp. Root1221]